jgi:chordin
MSMSDDDTRRCQLGGIFHFAGSSWYPFLHPTGFDKCTICTCDVSFCLYYRTEYSIEDLNCLILCIMLNLNMNWFLQANSLQIRFDRERCPPLACPDREALKPEGSCCKVCPPTTPSPTSLLAPFQLQDPPKTKQDILDEGGCMVRKVVYENGKEWHPRIASHGIEKCITCRCKVSTFNKHI